MPDEIILVRHAQCTGNAMLENTRKGIACPFEREVRIQKSDFWPLTQKGIDQSKEAGILIQKYIDTSFDRYLYSPFIRACQTGHLLGFKNAVWEENEYLKERHWGGIENLSYDEFIMAIEKSGVSIKEDCFDWKPPGGESMSQLLIKATTFLTDLEERTPNGKVLIVSHGGPIQAMRVILHQITNMQYEKFIGGNNYIRNCQIFHFFQKKRGFSKIPFFDFERKIYIEKNSIIDTTLSI